MAKMTKEELDELVRVAEAASIPNWTAFTPHRVFIEAWWNKDEATDTVFYSGSIRFMLDDVRSITIRTDRVADDAKWALRQTAMSIAKAFDNIAVIGLVFDGNGEIIMQCNLDDIFAEYGETTKPVITADSFPPMTNTTVH